MENNYGVSNTVAVVLLVGLVLVMFAVGFMVLNDTILQEPESSADDSTVVTFEETESGVLVHPSEVGDPVIIQVGDSSIEMDGLSSIEINMSDYDLEAGDTIDVYDDEQETLLQQYEISGTEYILTITNQDNPETQAYEFEEPPGTNITEDDITSNEQQLTQIGEEELRSRTDFTVGILNNFQNIENRVTGSGSETIVSDAMYNTKVQFLGFGSYKSGNPTRIDMYVPEQYDHGEMTNWNGGRVRIGSNDFITGPHNNEYINRKVEVTEGGWNGPSISGGSGEGLLIHSRFYVCWEPNRGDWPGTDDKPLIIDLIVENTEGEVIKSTNLLDGTSYGPGTCYDERPSPTHVSGKLEVDVSENNIGGVYYDIWTWDTGGYDTSLYLQSQKEVEVEGSADGGPGSSCGGWGNDPCLTYTRYIVSVSETQNLEVFDKTASFVNANSETISSFSVSYLENRELRKISSNYDYFRENEDTIDHYSSPWGYSNNCEMEYDWQVPPEECNYVEPYRTLMSNTFNLGAIDGFGIDTNAGFWEIYYSGEKGPIDPRFEVEDSTLTSLGSTMVTLENGNTEQTVESFDLPGLQGFEVQANNDYPIKGVVNYELETHSYVEFSGESVLVESENSKQINTLMTEEEIENFELDVHQGADVSIVAENQETGEEQVVYE